MTTGNNTAAFASDTNQALSVAQFCLDALWSADPDKRLDPSPEVVERTVMFFTDAVACGLSAAALCEAEGLGAMRRMVSVANSAEAAKDAPALCLGRIKRWGATMLGHSALLHPARVAFIDGFAMRAWDANGTNFAYYPETGHTAGEFGHNDFYGAVLAATQMVEEDGSFAIRAMILLDEIRNRLGAVYSLKDRHLDHVLHGGIATAFVVGAILGLTAEQIEQAVGVYVAHYVPTRANRAGEAEIADSKGAAAGIAAENAFESVIRVMHGFAGPRDIFRISEGIFRLLGGPGVKSKVFARADGKVPAIVTDKAARISPFDLILTRAGSNFAIMQMHIKLALYEHQSAGALAGALLALRGCPKALSDRTQLEKVTIRIYNPAADIICQPARRNPTTREAADHSCYYIVARLLDKALRSGSTDWGSLMLGPLDFTAAAINDPNVRQLMAQVDVVHEPTFDPMYPEGIPTEVKVSLRDGTSNSSGLVMFPPGHAKYDGKQFGSFADLFRQKLSMLGELAFGDAGQAQSVLEHYAGIYSFTAEQVRAIHSGYTIPNRSHLMH